LTVALPSPGRLLDVTRRSPSLTSPPDETPCPEVLAVILIDGWPVAFIMGTFEKFASLEMKLRIVMIVAVLTFFAVGIPIFTVFQSRIGLVIGAVAAVAAAYVTAKKLP
jgi:hypothetical protein